MTTQVPFTKMVGTGNDFLVIDARTPRLRPLRGRWRAMSRTLCDRQRGVGADGLLVLERSRRATVRMRVFNPDGSEAEMCGNGARCVALYEATSPRTKLPIAGGLARRNVSLRRTVLAPDCEVQCGVGASDQRPATQQNGSVTIETGAGVLSAQTHRGRVALRMTDPSEILLDGSLTIGGRRLAYGFVNTGVPHVVIATTSLERVDVMRLGRAIRSHRQFAPRGTNVNFIHAHARRPWSLQVRTYERGVEGETLACGTGITASAIVHALHRGARSRRCQVEVTPRSGDRLTVSFDVRQAGSRLRVTQVVLEGPATRVFNGTVGWPIRGDEWP